MGTLTIPQSYIADTADADSTSRWFALFQGAFFCGNGLGPLVASVISHYTGFLVLFYVAIAMHITFLLLVWLAIPESLLPAQMEAARQEHAREKEMAARRARQDRRSAPPRGGPRNARRRLHPRRQSARAGTAPRTTVFNTLGGEAACSRVVMPCRRIHFYLLRTCIQVTQPISMLGTT